MPIWLTCLSAKYPVACPAKGQLANARLRILVHRRCRHPLVSKPRPKSERLPSPRGQVKTLPPTSLLSRFWLGHVQYGSSGRTALTLHEGSLLRAFRVSTPGQVSTATLPSVIRGGYRNHNHNHNNNNSNNNNNNNKNKNKNKNKRPLLSPPPFTSVRSFPPPFRALGPHPTIATRCNCATPQL